MQKRVLITGVSGFAGRYLAAHMAGQGFKVYGCSHANAGALDGVEHLQAVDLLDASALAAFVETVQPTHVVHLAAVSFVGHEDVREIYDVNIVGSRNLLSALSALSRPPEAVVLTSSANVYGNSDLEFLSETDALNPANDYAVSKVGMEMMSRQFSSILNLKIVRPFNYTGRGQSENFLVPKIVAHFRKDAPFIELGNTDVARDFSDVRDVTSYIERLLLAPEGNGEVFNICSGRPISLAEIIAICEEISGRTMEVRVNPRFQRPNEIKVLAGNPEKLFRTVGKKNTHPIVDTLRWMLEKQD